MTATSDAAREAHALLDATITAIEAAPLDGQLFDTAVVPEVQESMDRARMLSATLEPLDEVQLRVDTNRQLTIFS